jgi:hypothetical protein
MGFGPWDGSVWVLDFLKSEFNFNSLREFWDLTLWDKIWKSQIKYDLFFKKVKKNQN